MDKTTDADAEKSRWAIAARRVLLGVAILMAASQATLAAPTTLVCHNDTRPADPDITVDLNEAKGSVTINYPANYNAAGIFNPAVSQGPFAAKFDSRTITFDQKTATNYGHNTIDRLTGAFLQYNSSYAPWDRAMPQNKALYHFTCNAGEKKF